MAAATAPQLSGDLETQMMVAVFGECFGDGFADAPACASDECDAVHGGILDSGFWILDCALPRDYPDST